MSTATNAYLAKKALIDWLTTLPTLQALDDVEVTYGYRGAQSVRRLVHAGRAESTQEYPVSGSGSARFKRNETLIVKLHVVVREPGGDQADAEQTASDIGTVIEEAVATTARIPGLDNLIRVGIIAVDLDSDVDDDAAMAVLTYDVEVFARLT